MVQFKDFITKNDKMLSVISVAEKISHSDISVLIFGEDGVGKTMLARAIHDNSPRSKNNFVIINCSSIPPSAIDAELFGSDKLHSQGQLELARHGTLFIDEIGSLDLVTQAKLFQALESGQFKKSNGELVNNVKTNLIASTSEDLIEKVETGSFRMDLYYRIKEISLDMPALRERKEDIPLLIELFVNNFSKDFGKKIKATSDVAINFLMSHEWKGNVRELRNVMRTAVALCEKDKIWIEDIPLKMELSREKKVSGGMLNLESFALKDVEKNHILKTLDHCRWNKSKAAKLLKISRPRIDRKISEYKLKKPDSRKRKSSE